MADEARRAAPDPEPTRLQRAKKAYGVVGDILTPGRIALLVAALVLLVTGLVGGWEAATATDDDTPVVTAGKPQDVTPFEITVQRLRHGDELPGVAPLSETHRYLFLVLDVTNTTDAPVDFTKLARAITIDADGLLTTPDGIVHRPQVYRGNDGLLARTYPPGVVTPTVLVWSQDRDVPPPDEVGLTLNAFIWRYSAVEERESWFDEEPTATMTLEAKPMADA